MLFQCFVSVFYFRDVRTPEIKQNFVSSQPTTGSIKLQLYFGRPHIPETKHSNSFRIVSASLNIFIRVLKDMLMRLIQCFISVLFHDV